MPKGEQDPEIVCHVGRSPGEFLKAVCINSAVCQDLVNEAILEKNSRDNVTCMIVMLKRSIKGRN